MKNTTSLILTAVFFVATAITLTACGGESFTDPRDGQTYKTVKIGDQVWMAENLKYKGGAGEVDESGAEYTWDSALVACPEGWHLPSKSEMESIASDTNFKDLWSSTEKEDFSLFAYKKYDNISASNKRVYLKIRCIQGKGESQPYISKINGYKSVRIGEQIWMANNLNIETPNSICYLEDADECSKGRFYTISEAKTICPEGWRLPNQKDASKLINKLTKLSKDYNTSLEYLIEKIMGPKMGYYDNSKFEYGTGSLIIGHWILSDGYYIENHTDLKIERLRSWMHQPKFNVRCIASPENKE